MLSVIATTTNGTFHFFLFHSSSTGRFFTQKDVKRHLVVHTGVRNFACPYCTQRFGRKDHLVRHAKKSHGQDTRSFKRRSRQTPQDASSSATESKRPSNRKGSSRSRRKGDEAERGQHHFEPSSTASSTIVSTTSITSPSTSYYLHDNGFSSVNRGAAATSTNPHFNNSTIMLSSTSTSPLTPFPKMTLVDVHSSTSTLTASFTQQRNYSSFNYESSTAAAVGSNFNYNINGASAAVAFNQFLPPPVDGSAGGTQYSLQLPPPPPPGNTYLNYEYKPPPSNTSVNYASSSNSHHEAYNSGHLSGPVPGHGNGAGNISFKAITAEGFNNTCIELEYSAATAAAAGMANAFSSSAPIISSSVPFGESGHHVVTRFHSPFN